VGWEGKRMGSLGWDRERDGMGKVGWGAHAWVWVLTCMHACMHVCIESM
jgi:hypothetical protein